MKKDEVLKLIRSIELDDDLTKEDLKKIKWQLGNELAIINSKIIGLEDIDQEKN